MKHHVRRTPHKARTRFRSSIGALLVAAVLAQPATLAATPPTKAPVTEASITRAPSTRASITKLSTVQTSPAVTPDAVGRPALTIFDIFTFQTVTKSGAPGRWDPCVPISWRLYKPGAPKGAVALLKKSFNKVSAITGLVFEYRGYAPRSAVRGGTAGITIGFMPRSSMLEVEGVPDASGSASLSGFEMADGRIVYTSATVTLLRSRFSPRAKVSVWEPLILHELGHAVGLDHVDDRSQVMYPYEQSFRSYQYGDEAGLKLLGAAAGCNPISP
jgi:hypothetical protein